MLISKCLIEANLSYNGNSIDSFLLLCEHAINNMTESKSMIFKLKSATHELIVNAIEHGYESTSGYVSFSIYFEQSNICLEIKDKGKGIPEEVINFKRNADKFNDLTLRGWGLMLIKDFCDSFDVVSNTQNGTHIKISVKV